MKAKVWGTWWGHFPEYVSIVKHEMTLCLRGWEYDLAEGRSLFGLYSEKNILRSKYLLSYNEKKKEIRWNYNISYQNKITKS